MCSYFLAHENNAHCMAIVMNLLPQALFTITGEKPEEKMSIFLKVTFIFCVLVSKTKVTHFIAEFYFTDYFLALIK